MEGIHAQTLAERGFGADVGFCCKIDELAIAPTLVAESDADSVFAPVILIRWNNFLAVPKRKPRSSEAQVFFCPSFDSGSVFDMDYFTWN